MGIPYGAVHVALLAAELLVSRTLDLRPRSCSSLTVNLSSIMAQPQPTTEELRAQPAPANTEWKVRGLF